MSDNLNASDKDEAKTVALNVAGADDKISEEVASAICQKKIEIAVGRRRDDVHWVNQTFTVEQLGDKYFTGFQRGPKDGACILSGSVVAPRRLKNNMARNSLVLLDHDTGETMDEVAAAIEALGLFSVLWNTHSHLKTISDVGESGLVNFLKKAPEFSSQGYTRPDTDETVLIEQLRAYFRDLKGLKTEIISSMHEPARVHADGGIKYTVSHDPLHRLRSLFVLDEPYDFSAGIQKERQDEWSERYGGFCIETLGVKYDRSCADPSRLMYVPRIARDADENIYEIRVIDGRALTLDDMPRHNPRARAQEPNAFTEAARELGSDLTGAGKNKATTFVTKNMPEFAARGAASFAGAEWAEETAPEEVRGRRGTKLTKECPNDGAHSNPGDPNDQGFWVENAQDRDEGVGFMMSCSHATCKEMSGGDRLFYLDLECQKRGIEDALELRPWCGDWKESAKRDDLPPGFMRENGNIYLRRAGGDDEDDEERGLLICSGFQCAARARDSESGAWARVLEFNNSEGVPKSISVADAELQGDGVEVRARLAGEGLFISTNPKARREFMRLLNTVRSENRVRHSSKTGFMGENNEVFLLPVEVDGAGAVFAPDASDELKAEKHVWTKRPPKFTEKAKGDLAGWQAGVDVAFRRDEKGEIAAPHVAESILRGATGPAIALTDRDPIGIHYVGASSTGKTNAGMAQVSLWSDVLEGRGLMVAAKATANGMESLVAMFNNTTGVINDLENGADPNLARDLPYMIANKSGKARMNKNAEARTVASWTGFAFTMNSERSPQQLMGKHVPQTSGGLVRAPVLNTSNVPKMDKALIDEMMEAFKGNFGHAGPRVVAGIYKRGWHRDCTEMKRAIAAYHKEHTGDLEPAQRRALEVYAYARVVGDLMVEDGILGPDITKDDVAAVVKWALDQAKAASEFKKMRAAEDGARRVYETLNTSGLVYDLDEQHFTIEGRPTALAYKSHEKGVVYIPESSFGKFEGVTTSEADIVEEWKRSGLLIKNGDRWKHRHLPCIDPVTHYRLSLPKALEHYGEGGLAPEDEHNVFTQIRKAK